jgi:hypothetical protein
MRTTNSLPYCGLAALPVRGAPNLGAVSYTGSSPVSQRNDQASGIIGRPAARRRADVRSRQRGEGEIVRRNAATHASDDCGKGIG